jgi:nucleoside-diphosphate kinase
MKKVFCFFSVFSLFIFSFLCAVSVEGSERTLSIIKPDAVQKNHIGNIISRFEKEGLHVVAIRMTRLTPEKAGQFYHMHKERSFFPDLVKLMTSGPIVAMVLEGNDAIAKNRQLMGATDPKKAIAGTIRADLAESMTRNAVHGSDSAESAKEEIQFFFSPTDIYSH